MNWKGKTVLANEWQPSTQKIQGTGWIEAVVVVMEKNEQIQGRRTQKEWTNSGRPNSEVGGHGD